MDLSCCAQPEMNSTALDDSFPKLNVAAPLKRKIIDKHGSSTLPGASRGGTAPSLQFTLASARTTTAAIPVRRFRIMTMLSLGYERSANTAVTRGRRSPNGDAPNES